MGCRSDGKCMSAHSNVLCYFLEIFDYIYTRFSRSFLKVTFDSFSSSALSIEMPGRHGREAGGFLACVFSHHPPWHSGKPHYVTIPPKIQSASYSEGKYSVGTNEVLL